MITRKSLYFLLAVLMGSFPFSSLAQQRANGMRTSCHLETTEGAKVEGQNLGQLFEIASVSKVFTTYWAIQKLTPQFRFQTRFHVTPVPGTSQYDLHIEGGSDPLFDREQFYLAVAELNKLKIQRIRNLTYDENFYFLIDPRIGDAVDGYWAEHKLSPAYTQLTLPRVLDNIRWANNQTNAAEWKEHTFPSGYVTLRRSLKARYAMELPFHIILSRASTKHLAKQDFVAQDSTRTYSMASLPLYKILKELNRSSNNRASEIIFRFLGDRDAFKKFMFDNLGLDDTQVQIVNGSGYPDITAQPKFYNMATCEAVISVLVALNHEMVTHKMQIEDVLAFSAPTAEHSTIAGRYGHGEFQSSLSAKTGTVDPAVSLAGVLYTKHGGVYFSHIHSARGPSTWNAGRTGIFRAMQTLLQKYGGSAPITYDYETFSQVDDQSVFKEVVVHQQRMP